MPKLIISERGKERERAHECAESIISIGRDEENVIVLDSPGVSRSHARVISEGENFFVFDLGSGNGTELNGRQIKGNEKNLLRNGDVITIDAFDLRFACGEQMAAAAEDEITESDILEVKLLKKVLSALDRETVPSLEVLNGVDEGKKLYLTDDTAEMVIGRDPDCSFQIGEHVISRRHAKIAKRWGGIAIRDLESKNGTFINNRRVVEEFLHDGDRIALGTIVLMFRNPQEINIAELEAARPKRTPAQVSPKDIPFAEGEPEGAPEAAEEKAEDKEMKPPEEEASEALKDWDELERSLSKAPYPKPQPVPTTLKRLTPTEIGMIGLGALVLLFALITFVNLLFS